MKVGNTEGLGHMMWREVGELSNLRYFLKFSPKPSRNAGNNSIFYDGLVKLSGVWLKC